MEDNNKQDEIPIFFSDIKVEKTQIETEDQSPEEKNLNDFKAMDNHTVNEKKNEEIQDLDSNSITSKEEEQKSDIPKIEENLPTAQTNPLNNNLDEKNLTNSSKNFMNLDTNETDFIKNNKYDFKENEKNSAEKEKNEKNLAENEDTSAIQNIEKPKENPIFTPNLNDSVEDLEDINPKTPSEKGNEDSDDDLDHNMITINKKDNTIHENDKENLNDLLKIFDQSKNNITKKDNDPNQQPQEDIQQDPAEENLNDLIENLDAVEGTMDAENDYIISDPEEFIRQYNDYLTYKSIDNFTIVALIESNFFAKSNELVLSKSEFITFELFKMIMNMASSATIKILRLQGLQIRGKAIKYLSKCKYISLKELEFDSCPFIDSESIDSYFHSKENVLKNLNKIIFKKTFIEDSCIASIINASPKMPELRELVFIDCNRLNSDGFLNIFKINSIKSLYLESLKISDKVLSKFAVSEALSSLETFTMINITGLNEQCLVDFFASPYLNSLKNIEIRGLSNIKGLFLSQFQSKTSDVISIRLANMNSLSQENIEDFLRMSSLKNLKILEISQMYNISNNFAIALSSMQFNNLEELTMNYFTKMNSSSMVLLLSSALTNTIKTLNLENCTGLSDFPSNMTSLSKCNLKNLEKLNLNYCARLSSYLIQAIGTISSLTNLKILSLNGVQTLDDVTCLYLTKSNYFQNIKELYLENCPNITIRSFQELMRSVMTVNMEILSLDGNSQLNDDIWTYICRSNNLKKLKELKIKGLNIGNERIDEFISSEKMSSIEIIHLTDACYAFPSFYRSETCFNLKKIEGSWDNVTPEEAENLLKSKALSDEFQFQDIINKVVMDDDIMKALTNSIFLKKIWDFPQCDIRDMNTESIEKMLLSPNLNPFFNLDMFLKEMKAIINDSVLRAMANNRHCVNNLFEIDLVGAKHVTIEGIKAILNSKFLCPLFNISGFLKSLKYMYGSKANLIIPLITKGNFTSVIKKLDLGDYELENGILRNDLLLQPNVFRSLRALNLSRTNIDDKDLTALGENNLMNILIALDLNSNPSITSEGFQSFFEILAKKNIVLRKLDLEYCKITNGHLQTITGTLFAKKLQFISVAGCKDIDGSGLNYILELYNKYKRINMKKIYEDFKHFINLDEKRQYTIRQEIDADTNEIYLFLKNISDGKKTKKGENERKRFMIRDKVIISLLNEKRANTLKKIDLNNCNITSKSLNEMSKSIYLKHLEELYLENTNIDDEGINVISLSQSLPNLKKINMNYCNYITKASLHSILNSNFHPEFNPDQIISNYAPKVDSDLLKLFIDNKYFRNFKKLNFTKNNDLNLSDLETMMQMQKTNQGLDINLNLNQIFEKDKSRVKNKTLLALSDSKILSIPKTLDLAGAPVSEEGLIAILASKYINHNFIIQPIINSFSNLVDDDILKAISRGAFFRNITEINLKSCPKITSAGILNIARSPNPDFQIQGLLEDFGDKIDSIFIKNMVQQDYFENLTELKLTCCKTLNTEDLLTIIKTSHEEFDLEKFIKPENLPNSNSDLITNEVLKAISQSPFFIKRFLTDNTDADEERIYFDFNIKLYRQVNYGINYFIEQNLAPIEDYDDYLNNFAYYLSLKSLMNIIKIHNSGDEREDVKCLKNQLSHVNKLDFSQNKQIYNSSFQGRLIDAFDNVQNQYNLNLEKESIDYFANRVIEIQEQCTMLSDTDEEYKDVIIFKLLKLCPNLEEINLNNLNLGDYFIKLLSNYLTKEKDNTILNLINLKVFKIRNNSRFTSVGLKYLYCAAVKRTDIVYIDVSYKGQVPSGITYFVNNGLIGMIDYYLKIYWKKLQDIYTKKKGRFMKFVLNTRSWTIFGKAIMFSPILFFHLFEKILHYIPIAISALLKPFKPLQIAFKKCMKTFLDCFYQDSLPQKKKRTPSTLLSQPSTIIMSTNSINSSTGPKKKKKIKSNKNKNRSCKYCCCLFCFKTSKKDPISEDFHETLRYRYEKNKKNIEEEDFKESETVKNQSLFYFDESLMVLNSILGNEKEFDEKQIDFSDALEKDKDFYNFRVNVHKKFFFLSALRWIFLVNFMIYYLITFIYLLFWKLNFDQDADINIQIPFFVYLGLVFILEAFLCFEVVKIINNPLLINMGSSMVISSLLGSIAAKYDLFTDFAYVLSNFSYDRTTGNFVYGNIFLASLSVLSIKLILNFQEFFEFFKKSFCKKRKKDSYSSKYINAFSKLCFTFEFQGLGRILDKFSTASAEKYKKWWLPKNLYNVYIPMVITGTFNRLIIEDIPQLIIQMIDIGDKGKTDFTTLAALSSTVVALLMTLHTAWNVRPSYFSRDVFKLYHETLMKTMNGEDNEDSISDSSSHMDGSIIDQSEQRSNLSIDERNQMQIDMKELGNEEERDELFGAKKSTKITFKEEI